MSGKVGSGSFAFLQADGYDLLGAKPKTFSVKIDSGMERTDGLGDTTEAQSPTGLTQVTLTQSGAFFDDTTNNMHDAWKASGATSRILVAAWAGNTVGQPMIGCQGIYGHAYEALGSVGGLTKANVSYAIGGVLDRGVILQPSATKTADWNTKTLGTPVDYTTDTSQRVIPIASNSKAAVTVVTTTVPHGLTTGDLVLIAGVSGSSPTINGSRAVTVISTTTFSVPVDTSGGSAGTGGTLVRANSANGGVGYLSVSAFSGFSGFVAKIKHSTDDTTYTDLVTFSNVTSGPTAQRVTCAGTVGRYLCVDGDVTGTGSITLCVGFARS